MKTLGELLRDREGLVAQGWLEAGLTTYPSDSASAFRRQKDPFANPVGHSLRRGTAGILAALLEGGQEEKIREHLDEIIRIRAVQQIQASEAIGFVFALKQVVREELGDAAGVPEIAVELEELDREIDRVALAAFDAYVECRERVSELRIDEIKRQVSWIMDKVNRRGSHSAMARADSAGPSPRV